MCCSSYSSISIGQFCNPVLLQLLCSIDSIRIIYHLSTPPTPTTHPHTSVEEGVAVITSLQLDSDAEFILVRCYGVGCGRVSELLHDVSGTGAPAERFHGDVCWWLVLCLEEIVGVDARGEIAED